MESPRALLANDLPGMLETVTQLLRDDIEIVGYVQDGEEAIKAATTYNPDLLVLDIEMPFRNGIQVASHLRDSPLEIQGALAHNHFGSGIAGSLRVLDHPRSRPQSGTGTLRPFVNTGFPAFSRLDHLQPSVLSQAPERVADWFSVVIGVEWKIRIIECFLNV
jgi:CheY-like chemotaxis protein